MKTRDLILDQLKHPAVSNTFYQLQSVLTWLTYDSLRGAINRLLKAGTIEKNAAGEYFIPAPKVPAMPKIATVIKKKITRNILVLDNSGSMSGIAHHAKKSFNQTIMDIQANARKFNETSTISSYLFGERITSIEKNKPANITTLIYDYTPNEGGTRLFDAVAQAISDHESNFADQNADVSYLVIVITDGEENRSYNYTKDSLNALMTAVQKTDKWTITFQLPKYAKQHFCANFNIPEGNVTEWEQNEAGVRMSTLLRSAGVGSYYAARSQGASKVSNFYTVNAADIKVRDLK